MKTKYRSAVHRMSFKTFQAAQRIILKKGPRNCQMLEKKESIPIQNTHDLLVGTLSIGIPSIFIYSCPSVAIPTPRVFISRYTNTGKQFSIVFIKQLSREKNAKLFVWHWLKKKFLPVAKFCPRSLARVISSCFAKRCFAKYGFFSLKMSA